MEKQKFYTCKSDVAFKEVFMNKNNKDILKALLESILKLEINDIEYLNLEKNVDNVNVKRKHFDLFLNTNIGKIQVEVNSELKPYIRNRNAAYIFDTYSHETLRGEKYTDIKLIVQINFTYGLGKKEKNFRVYKLMDEEGIEYISNLLIYEYNMDYYEKIWYSNDKEMIDESKYIIMQNLGLDDLEKLSKTDKVVKKYMSELERVNEIPEFREYMSAEEDNRKIENTMRDYAIKEGLQQGIQQGLQQGIQQGLKQGIQQGIKESAKGLIKNGVDLDIISKSLNLTIDELEKMKKELI